ncbi:hypothetical protein ASPZODRAFT_1651542 [Penicilliopsis zonata CBS 506.65]|uniref:Uncharacterized protein n=1 Tax=Penicilliopsis zonata CBS 506.65 TaxID=1073090 RepID=A0A1L9SN68_9EURO|nr:hypothetical protein ASPZODRAFT_1651542 [Penicilliopsis zonata CBS 506.65]OJJ48650.1 hypothetical protein ASPZODRAFT_1651542 [Penicilliopsis zonata CBS 506.65]
MTTSSINDIQGQDTGYDADVEVVKPYEIEEPDDEYAIESPRPGTPVKALEGAGGWQEELVDSMQELYCDSDTTQSPLRDGSKRGLKRKPTNSSRPEVGCQSQPAEKSSETTAALSPKRLRRRSRRSREGFRPGRAAAALWHIHSRTPSCEISTPAGRSTSASTFETANEEVRCSDNMDTSID